MLIEELLDIIEKEFSFLFEQHGFQVTYTNSRHNQDSIGLKSKNLKILFVIERGIDIKIGTTNVTFDAEVGWINLKHLIDFVLHRSIDWDYFKKNKSNKDFLAVNLSKTAKDLQLINKKIFEMFQDEKSINQWKSQYEHYIDEEINRRFGV